MAIKIPPALDPVEAVKEKFGDALLHVKEFAGETTLIIEGEQVVDVLRHLKEAPGLVYNFLSDISAVDYYPNDYGNAYDGDGSDFRPERYGVSYHIYSMLYNRRLRVKAFALEEEPVGNVRNPYWLGPFRNYRTFCPYLVGSYERLGDQISKYYARGYRTVILDIPPNHEELEHTDRAFTEAAKLVGA